MLISVKSKLLSEANFSISDFLPSKVTSISFSASSLVAAFKTLKSVPEIVKMYNLYILAQKP